MGSCFKPIIPDSEEHPFALSGYLSHPLLRWIRANLPAQGAFLNTRTPTFDWGVADVDVDVYRLQVVAPGGNIDTGPYVIDSGDITQTQFPSPVNLEPDGVYQWRVIARDQGSNTAASVPKSFRVDTDIVDPVLVTPIDGAIVGVQTPRFTWTQPFDDSPVTFTLQAVKSGDPFRVPFAINAGGITSTQFEVQPGNELPVDPATNVTAYTWRVQARDAAGNDSNFVTGDFIININVPAPPVLISPIDETAETLTTFKWDPDNLAEAYDLQIATADFINGVATGDFTILVPDIPHVLPISSVQSHTLINQLDAGKLYLWRIRAKSNTTGLIGEFSAPAAFIIRDAKVPAVILDVLLEGTGDLPVDFEVKLYDSIAFRGIEATPWFLFTGDRAKLLRRTISFTGLTGTTDLASGGTRFTLVLNNVDTGFFDITIEADRSLINLKDDAGLHAGLADPVDMGRLLVGNAIDDQRGLEFEPASIINALDASLVVAAIGTSVNDPTAIVDGDPKNFDSRVDFDRDGDVDAADFALMKNNYLIMSPLIVVP